MESKSKEIKLDQKIDYSLDKIPVLSCKSLVFYSVAMCGVLSYKIIRLML